VYWSRGTTELKTMSYLKVERSELLELLRDKRVFVTGGTGSFGSTFVDLCLSTAAVASVTVFSRDEQKHVALRRRFPDKRLRTMLGDVRDLERLRFTMRGSDFVFNAAALKHVHFTEAHPMEAVNTNIIGAFNVCQVAAELGVEAVVDLSTDKAVEPVNAMGMTKALQERIVTSFAGGRTRFGVVRYGNVLASNGSVVPYFKRLLEEGNDRLPITDKRMTRFVLTLGDSVDLVLYAMRECRNGEIYVLDLPAFLIADVAEVMAERARSPVEFDSSFASSASSEARSGFTPWLQPSRKWASSSGSRCRTRSRRMSRMCGRSPILTKADLVYSR